MKVVGRWISDGDAELLRQHADHAVFADELHVHERLAKTTTPLPLMPEGRLQLVLVEETRVDQELA
jgi:hypothetical protein